MQTNINDKISMYEFARWAALLEAVDIIAEKCEDKGIDFNSSEGIKYIKPLDIQDYVNVRTDTLLNKIKTARSIEKNLNNIKCLQIEKQLKVLEIAE
jgi:virulence-associated protein VapD